MDTPASRQRPPDADDSIESSRHHTRFIVAVVIIAAAGLWIPQLTSSFRTDETATHWIISGSFGQTVHRSLEFEGESPFYFIVQRGVRTVLGSSEVALRIPSLLAVIAATVLLWLLGRRLVDNETALLSAVILVSTLGVAFVAGDARPYGPALLLVVASTLALVRWEEKGSPGRAVAYILVTAAALYMHYFTATALAIHPLYVWRRRGQVRPVAYGVAILFVAMLMIPIVPHLVALYNRRGMIQITFPVSLESYFDVMIPSVLVGSITLGFLLARLRHPLHVVTPKTTPGASALILGWWLIPPAILYVITLMGSTTLFEPRFFFFAIPGLALAGGLAISIIDPPRARRIIAVAIAIGALAAFNTKTHSAEDWRQVARAEREVAKPDTPVLLRPGFIESSDIDWLTQSRKATYLLSMLSPYPMIGRIIPVPYDFTSGARTYLDPVVETLSSTTRFLLVNDRGVFRRWLEGRLPEFETRTIAPGGVVTLIVFERRRN